MIHIHIITLFPKAFDSYFESSILGSAVENGHIEFQFYNPIDFKENKRVDDRPFGGGPGMVMEALPVLKAYNKALGDKENVLTIFLDRNGENFNNEKAVEYASNYEHIILICGHYEGIDHRVVDIIKPKIISIGDFVLTGGELPAMVIADSISREIQGVLGNPESREHTRSSSAKVYTRPAELCYEGEKYTVPDVLISGNHKDIELWREEN